MLDVVVVQCLHYLNDLPKSSVSVGQVVLLWWVVVAHLHGPAGELGHSWGQTICL